MSKLHNYIQVIGNMADDTETSQTKSGKDKASFRLGVYKGKDDTMWVPAVVFENDYNSYTFDKAIELRKGDRVMVSGQLDVYSFQNDDGDWKNITKIIVDNILVISTKEERGAKEVKEVDNSQDEDFVFE